MDDEVLDSTYCLLVKIDPAMSAEDAQVAGDEDCNCLEMYMENITKTNCKFFKFNGTRSYAIVKFEQPIRDINELQKKSDEKPLMAYKITLETIPLVDSVLVTDLPFENYSNNLADCELVLYFEIQDLCPDGGIVEDIEVLPCYHAAVVQFADPAVVHKLKADHKLGESHFTVRPLNIFEFVEGPCCSVCNEDNGAGKVEEAEASAKSLVISSKFKDSNTADSMLFYDIRESATDVSNCTAEVRKLLNVNPSTTRSIKHKIGVIRLLKTQSHEMTAEVNASTGASVQLEFDVRHGLIKVIGVLDQVDKAAKFIDANYVKVVCYDKYEANIQDLTFEMFKSKTDLGSEMIDLLEMRYKCVIEVRGNSARAAEPQRAHIAVSKPAKKKSHKIQLQQGSIVEFQADVLVNSIATRNLERAGVVTKCFLKAGGSKMQQELRQSVPHDFGNDVVVTSAGGRLNAKFIFHAAIRRYRNQESLDRLYKLIKKCLEMADKQRGVKSIAFPTLGCGKLGYGPYDVAECFSRAVKETGSDLQIFIIAFEAHLLQDFKSAFSHDSAPGSSDTKIKDDSWFGWGMKKIFSRPSNMPVNNRIVFHINAMSEDVILDVKGNLAKRINEMVAEAPIKDEAIADLSDETVSRIQALASPGVDIKIDRKKSKIKLKRDKSLVNKTRIKVLQLVYKECSTKERQSSIRYPKHWSFYKSERQPFGKMDHKRTELTRSGGGIFEEVSLLVMKTWEQQKVGLGNDATGLGPHTIKIRRIFCIENPALYRKYMFRREEIGREASGNKCHRVSELQEESEIMTLKLGLKQLDPTLASEVNECYLLHGTKHDMVDSIESTGLDSRLSSQKVLFGPGTYFTESSTKADQYADAKTQRSPNGQPLYIYVCRVLLGNTFICQTPKQFKRPPCMQAGCHSDMCANKHPFVGNFDSVIGTHKSPTVRLIFREFIIYQPDQSYPEFLVEYERQ